MTTSSWDNTQIIHQFAECTTLREIINRVESEFALKGEVICEIHVNGMMLSEEDEAKFAESPRAEIRDLTIRSNQPGLLIAQALDSAVAFIPQLSESCLKAAEAFRGHDLQAAQRSFNETLEGCTWLVETLTHIRGASSGVGRPIASADRWFEAEKTINRVVREVSAAYTEKDYVLVADLLEYEVTAALEIWIDAIKVERARW